MEGRDILVIFTKLLVKAVTDMYLLGRYLLQIFTRIQLTHNFQEHACYMTSVSGSLATGQEMHISSSWPSSSLIHIHGVYTLRL